MPSHLRSPTHRMATVLAGAAVVDFRYVFDNFQDVALTAIPSHVPNVDVVGGGWQAAGGLWRIDGDGVGMEHANNDCEDAIVIDSGQANVDITLITDPSTFGQGDFGVAFRYSALNAFYFFDYEQAALRMRVVKFNPGGSVVGTNTGDPVGGSRVTWRVRLSGNDITCWLDGVDDTLITVTDADLNTNTRHGARHCTISADVRYEQITIEPVGDGSEPPGV